MRNMRETWRTLHRVEGAIYCNKVIYTLSRIPLLGRLISEGLYARYGTKELLRRVFRALGLLRSAFHKLIYFFIVFGAAPGMIYGADILSSSYLEVAGRFFTWLFLMMNVLLGGMLQHRVRADPQDLSRTCLLHLRLDPKGYFISKALESYARHFSIMFLVMLALAPLLKYGVFAATALIILALGVRLLIDVISLTGPFMTSRAGRIEGRTDLRMLAAGPLIIALSYLPLFLDSRGELSGQRLAACAVSGAGILAGWPGLLLGLAAVAAGLFMIFRSPSYPALRKEELAAEERIRMLTGSAYTNVMVLKEKDIDLSDPSAGRGKHGYELLNTLFMKRHRRLFARRARISSAIVFLVPVAAAVVSRIAERLGAGFSLDYIYEAVGIWFFVIYLIAFKEQYTRALFNNIDRALLPFRWYRSREAIMKNYMLRLRSSFLMNGSITGSMALGAGTAALIAGVELKKFLLLLIVLTVLTFFYSMHYLTLYYLVQPYTEESRMKSPVYGIFNYIVYMGSYVMLQLRDVSFAVTGSVAAAVAVYLAVSLILLRNMAPRTFRMRE